LTLIHWPSPEDQVPVAEFMGQLLEAKRLGLTRQIGISNFTIDLMKQAIAAVGAENIATNQVELHPSLQNRLVVDFATANGIQITSYMTLAYGEVLKDPVIQQIAERHQATPAQVTLAWAMQLGYAVIPSSTKRANLASNLQALDLPFRVADMAQIAELERGDRLTSPKGIAPKWDSIPAASAWDNSRNHGNTRRPAVAAGGSIMSMKCSRLTLSGTPGSRTSTAGVASARVLRSR